MILIRYNFIMFSIALGFCYGGLSTMQENHLETLKNAYHKIKNKPEKLKKQLHHIELRQQKDTSVALAEYKQKVFNRLRYVTAYKQYTLLIESNSTYNNNQLEIHNDLIKELESVKTTDSLNNNDKRKAIIALKYLAVRLNTFTFFKNPKNASQFCPQSEQELNNVFLPFDGIARDAEGNNLLLWGIQHSLPVYALDYLLNCGLSWNERNSNGETALHMAIDKNPHSLQFILEKKVKTCTVEDITYFPFTTGDTNYKEWFEHALKEHMQLVDNQHITIETINAQDKNKSTALHKACSKRYTEAVELLLAAGADPKIKNGEKKNCIEILCDQPWNTDSTKIALSIFKHHPNLQTPYPELYTLVEELAAEKYKLEQATIHIQEYLMKKLDTQLIIQNKQKKISKTINADIKQPPSLQQKVPARQKVECTYSSKTKTEPLIFKKLRNPETLKSFLDKKKNKNLDVNTKNSNGFTPLKIVIDKANVPLATLLLERKADPNATNHLHLNKHGLISCLMLTPLELCTALQDSPKILELIKLLVCHKADFGKTKHLPPLNAMIYNQSTDGVTYILQQENIDVNAGDFFKNTPLVGACGKKNLAFVELLLQHKADPNLSGTDNIYPLDIAYKQNAHDIIHRLILSGATKSALSVMVNGEKIDLQDRLEDIKKILKKDYCILCDPSQTICIEHGPKGFFWNTLITDSAWQLMTFLSNEHSPKHTPEYNQLHQCYGYPLDYAYKAMAVKKSNIQKILLLLMNNITARSTTIANKVDQLTFTLNYKKVDILDPSVQEEIYKGFHEFKSDFPIWLHENTMFIASPNIVFWHYLLQDNFSTHYVAPLAVLFKEHVDKKHPEHGFPLDYAISQNSMSLVNLLLSNNVRTTSKHIMSNDTVTQWCLHNIGKTEMHIIVGPENAKIPTIFLQPANKNFNFSCN